MARVLLVFLLGTSRQGRALPAHLVPCWAVGELDAPASLPVQRVRLSLCHAQNGLVSGATTCPAGPTSSTTDPVGPAPRGRPGPADEWSLCEYAHVCMCVRACMRACVCLTSSSLGSTGPHSQALLWLSPPAGTPVLPHRSCLLGEGAGPGDHCVWASPAQPCANALSVG